jgi:RNA polymerase sigma-70 factor, ECF subfamily
MEASPALTSARRASAAEAPARSRPAADRAIAQLYDRHARDVYQYALALLANPADAEDATQTTFLNAYRALLRGDRPHRPQNWLITITHNVCRMRWRQAGQRPREVALDDAPEPVAPEPERPDLDAVLDALRRLSFNQRAALIMRELEGRSCKEIGKTLGVSPSSVEALLFRARRRLRLERDSLGVLTTAPFPASKLLSALGLGGGGGGGAVASGGAAVGADLAAKAAAVLAVGAIVTGAVGVATHVRHLGNSANAKTAPARDGATAKRTAPTPRRARPTRQATPTHAEAPTQAAQATEPRASGTTTVATAPAPTQPSPVGLPKLPAPSLPQLPLPPAQLPQLPQPPQLPALPVPLLPVPQLPQLPLNP